jgi:signal transduction histidine kinase
MKSPSILTKPAVWVPAAGIATITIVVNFLFIQADRYDARLINLGVQAAVGLVGILAIAVSYYFLKKLETVRHITANELALEKSLANQQLQLISDTHEALAQDLLVLTQLGVGIAKYPHTDGYITGRMELTRVVKKMEQLKELAAHTETNPQPIAVHAVVEDVNNQLAPLVSKHKVNLKLDEQPDLQTLVSKASLTHLINASLKNAIEASPEGSEVALKISKHKTSNNQGIQIKITDKGKGIPADKLDKLFKPFSTTQSPEQFTDSGLGLDLYFSKVITEQYGGSIQFKSVEGEGTEVVVRV